MSKQPGYEMHHDSEFEAPPYEKSQQPPAYGQVPPQGYPVSGVPPQPGYPPSGAYPPQQGYPSQGYPPPHQHVAYQGVPQQPYQYGNVVVQQPMYVAPTAGPPPPDHMTAAILATLFCFWPTGIIAIIRASDARAAAARGDYAAANSFSRSAKSMINYSICIGIITIIIIAVIMGVYFGFLVKQLYDLDDDFD